MLSAYALTLAALVLTAGNLADLFGRKRLLFVGLATYLAASLWCLAAASPLQLDLARGAQGVGAAMLFAASLAILADAYRGSARRSALGIWAAVVAASFAVGPLIGGACVQWLHWRWMFAVNLPLIAATAWLTAREVRESRDPDAPPVDLGGAAALTTSLLALVFGVIRGNAEGWTSAPILGALALGVASLAVFVLIESRERHPMLDLSLFRRGAFTGASVLALALHASLFALTVYAILFLLTVAGSSPFAAALQLLPYAPVAIAVAIGVGRLARPLPPRWQLAGGLALCGVGCLLMGGVDEATGWAHFLPGLLVAGVGIGLANPAITGTALAAVPPAHSGVAAGANNTFRQFGTAVGIAALGAILESRTDTGGSFVDGFNLICVVAAAIAFAGALVAIVLIRPQTSTGT